MNFKGDRIVENEHGRTKTRGANIKEYIARFTTNIWNL